MAKNNNTNELERWLFAVLIPLILFGITKLIILILVKVFKFDEGRALKIVLRIYSVFITLNIILFFVFLAMGNDSYMIPCIILVGLSFILGGGMVMKKRNKYVCSKCGKTVYGIHGHYNNRSNCPKGGEHNYLLAERNL